MLEKRSFTLAGHRTSVALEPEFWSALAATAKGGGRTLSALIAETDATRPLNCPLASALRVLALGSVWLLGKSRSDAPEAMTAVEKINIERDDPNSSRSREHPVASREIKLRR